MAQLVGWPRQTLPAPVGAIGPKTNARRQRARRPTAGLVDTLLRPLTSSGQKLSLNDGIASFYDQSSGLWESMWGDHMHHGYYPNNGARPKSNQQAQVDMIDEVVRWAGVSGFNKMVDVGCGIGGSSRYLIQKHVQASARGITLSPVQAQRANALAEQLGLATRTSFQVADALQQPFQDGEFDLVWSLESGEHMPDKRRFVGELARVCAPGGRIIIVTWCHRDLLPGESSLGEDELAMLDRINEAYYLPAWCSISDYRRLFEQQGMQDIRTADWSDEVAPFWGQVIKSAVSTQGLAGLFKAGWTTIKGALVMPLMARGYSAGLIKFNLITGQKPSA